LEGNLVTIPVSESPISDPLAPFSNSAALVFGGGRNIGRAVVLEFARRGEQCGNLE
jgi:hypothetical protein